MSGYGFNPMGSMIGGGGGNNMMGMNNNMGGGGGGGSDPRYKTKLCMRFLQQGSCSYGARW